MNTTHRYVLFNSSHSHVSVLKGYLPEILKLSDTSDFRYKRVFRYVPSCLATPRHISLIIPRVSFEVHSARTGEET